MSDGLGKIRPLLLTLTGALLILLMISSSMAIQVSYSSSGGSGFASASSSYDLDSSTSLQESVTMGGGISKTMTSAGAGRNRMEQTISGSGETGSFSAESRVESVGAMSIGSSSLSSGGSGALSQSVSCLGDAQVQVQAQQGSSESLERAVVSAGYLSASQSVAAADEITSGQAVAGMGNYVGAVSEGQTGSAGSVQMASVLYGSMSAELGTTTAGCGVSSSQSTLIEGAAGSISSSSVSDSTHMTVAGDFLGTGSIEADLSTGSDAAVRGSISVDGAEWMSGSDMERVHQEGGGLAVHGLRALDDGVGTFGVAAESGSLGENVATLMQGGSDSSYALIGWRWNTRDPRIQLYLKNDDQLAGEGLTAAQAQAAIAAAANTWDDAVGQNLFADGTPVIISSSVNTDNPWDGVNVHAWKYLKDAPSALAYSRTRYGNPVVDGYYSVLESDVSYNTRYSWSTDGVNHIDVQTVALHELGHTIGLGDLYTLPESDPRRYDYDQVMNAYNDIQRTLGNGDRAGAIALYGPNILRYILLKAYNGQYVAAEGGGGREVVANKVGSGWEIFGLADLGNSNVALQAPNGQYVCAENGGGGIVKATSNNIGSWETFRLLDLGANKIALQAYNGQYLCAEGGGGREVVANRDWVLGWETFEMIDPVNIALQAYNGQYLCAEGGGGREVVANRNWVNAWETFKLFDLGNSNIALRAYNGQYLCAEGGGGREVVANRNWVNAWETFKLIPV
ncbi:MAG: hypothetical protein H5T42_00555 [Methanothrix sp.]|nr:hypothetical protein [Methanothrix sp.]